MDMKTLHLLILIGIGISSIIVSIFFVESQEPGAIQEKKTYHVYFPGQASPILYSPFKKIVSGITEAKSIVGYDIGSPTYLPPGYSMQDVLVNQFNSSSYVEILVSNFPITQNTTDLDFWDHGGIVIYVEPIPPNLNPTRWASLYLKQYPNFSPIQFNGYSGVVNDITKGMQFDKDADNPASLVVFGNGERVWINGFAHSDELIKIARGMLAK